MRIVAALVSTCIASPRSPRDAPERPTRLRGLLAPAWLTIRVSSPFVGYLIRGISADYGSSFLPRTRSCAGAWASPGAIQHPDRPPGQIADQRAARRRAAGAGGRAVEPAFQGPSNPIGSVYTQEEAERLRRVEGWSIAEDAGRGWRRVVPSPGPPRIPGLCVIAAFVATGSRWWPVRAAGSRSSITRSAISPASRRWVDKGFAPPLLASALGVDVLVMTSGVAQVAVDLGTPRQRFLDCLTVAETEAPRAQSQFPPGCMGRKLEAVLQFVRSGGRAALSISVAWLLEAVRGVRGTRLVADEDPVVA
jgi:hypothetical protein